MLFGALNIHLYLHKHIYVYILCVLRQTKRSEKSYNDCKLNLRDTLSYILTAASAAASAATDKKKCSIKHFDGGGWMARQLSKWFHPFNQNCISQFIHFRCKCVCAQPKYTRTYTRTQWLNVVKRSQPINFTYKYTYIFCNFFWCLQWNDNEIKRKLSYAHSNAHTHEGECYFGFCDQKIIRGLLL